MRYRAPRVEALMVVAAATLAGCQGLTRRVSEAPSPCFQVLPAAETALAGQGRYVSLVRLRRLRAREVFQSVGGAPLGSGPPTTSLPLTSPPTSAGSTSTGPADAGRDACVVVYRGDFEAARVQQHAGGAATGRFAVVFVGLRSHQVRAVVLTDALPPTLRHR